MNAFHIESKKGDIAENVLMPGDPLRAKYIADNFLENVRLINDDRNMLGYTGYYKNKRVTIFGSGMGIPSIAIYSYELYKFFDVKKIIRIGTAGSMNKDIKLMDIVLAKNAYSPSSFAYVWNQEIKNILEASNCLNEKILKTSKKLNINVNYGTILTADVFTVYANIEHIIKKIPKNIKILANEMEAFGLFHIANFLNKEAACLLTIVDSKYDENTITEEEKVNNLNEMIILALESI